MADDTKWCPNCAAEYRPHVAECADCLVPLVDELPEQPDHSLAEWELHDWDESQLRALFVALDGRGIRHEWHGATLTLRTSRADEEEVDDLLTVFGADEELPPLDVDDDVPRQQVASPARRISGFIIDQVLLTGVGAVAFNALVGDAVVNDGKISPGWLLLPAVVAFAYHFLGVMLFGRTLGKHILDTRVVDGTTGELPSTRQAFVRAATPSVVGFVPIIGGVGVIVTYGAAMFDDLRRGLHDRLAGTVVVELPTARRFGGRSPGRRR